MSKKIKAIENIDKAMNAAEDAKKCKSVQEMETYLEIILLSCSMAKDRLVELENKINELI